MHFSPIILSVVTGATALFGDFIVFHLTYSDNSKVFKAVADNFVHAAVGFLSAVTFFSHSRFNITNHSTIYNVILCTLVASFIDVDHVFLAKSLHIKDLTSLKQRGVLHCTTAWILVAVVIVLLDHFMKKGSLMLAVMLLLASTSHHIRDGNRRGLWIYPFGHTPPLVKNVYIAVLCLLPNVFYYIYIHMKVSQKYVPITHVDV